MLSGKDLKEDLAGRENGRDGVDSTTEGLAEEDDVGLDAGVVLEAEKLAGASETLRKVVGRSARIVRAARRENEQSGPRRR